MIHTPLWLHTSVDVCVRWATNLSSVLLLGSALLLPSHLSPFRPSVRLTCARNQFAYFTFLNSEAAGETSLQRVNNIAEISTLSGHRHIPRAQIHTHAHWLYLYRKWAQFIVLNDSLSTQTTMAANKKINTIMITHCVKIWILCTVRGFSSCSLFVKRRVRNSP